jgi:hypothetical protein
MRIILLSTAAAILAGCASTTPPLCDRDAPWVKFGTTDDTCAAPVAFVRPDTSGDGFVMPPSLRPETPIIEPPKPPHLDREDPPAKPSEPTPVEPEKPEPEPETPAEPEKPQPEKPDHPKPEKPDKPGKDKDNSGLGNGDEGDCQGKGCSDGDNPGKHKGTK